MPALIKTVGLHFAFSPGEDVLKGIDLEIKAGDFLAVIGPNGSGKSTLARCFNALLFPTKGEVLVAGMSTLNPDSVIDIRRLVGMVFQNPDNQIVAATVEEDVAFGPENLGVPSREIRQRVDQALQTLGLTGLRRHEPHLLSAGQKQRLAIAGVLAMRPRCLVLDEPTAMLDPQGRQEVIASVKQLQQQGITIVYVTHFMEEALQADRVCVLNQGRISLLGSPREVFTRVDDLYRMGLEAPTVARLAYALRQRRINLSQVMEPEELVHELWKSKSGI